MAISLNTSFFLRVSSDKPNLISSNAAIPHPMQEFLTRQDDAAMLKRDLGGGFSIAYNPSHRLKTLLTSSNIF
jgi:hypothetical protein